VLEPRGWCVQHMIVVWAVCAPESHETWKTRCHCKQAPRKGLSWNSVHFTDVQYSYTLFSIWYNTQAMSIYTVIMTLAFLYQLNSGLSPFFVVVSAMLARPAIKSSCR
jgi:hypothetical protein